MNFRKLLTYLTVGTAAVIPFAGAQNPTILQGSYISNVFGNSNFVKNPNAQTNVANVTNATRSTTTPLVATSEFNLSLDAGQNATWTLRTFDAGMKGQNCEARFSYRGFATATTTAEIVQNSLVVAQLVLTPSTDPRIASINFPCGDLANATTFRIAQTTANMTGTNEIGGVYTGLATNMANVAQAETVAIVNNSTTTIVNNTQTKIIFTNESLDVYDEYDPATGIFKAKRAGVYEIEAITLLDAAAGWAQGETSELYLAKNGTQFISQRVERQAAGTYYVDNIVFGTIALAVGDEIQVNLFQNSGANINLLAGAARNIMSIKRFPTSSELVVTPERQNTFGSATWTNAGTGFQSISTSTWTAGNSTIFGNANATVYGPTATATGNTSEIKISNMPVGAFRIMYNGSLYANSAGSATNAECSVRIRETSTSVTMAQNVWPGIPNQTVDVTLTNIEGVFRNTAVGDRTFRVEIAMIAPTTGIVSQRCGFFGLTNANGASGGSSVGQPTIIVQPLDQPSNSALYVQGPVLAAATGAAIPTSYVGEVLTNIANATNIASGTTRNCGQLTLQPGVWDLSASQGTGFFTSNPTVTQIDVGISTTSATFGSFLPSERLNTFFPATSANTGIGPFTVGPLRVNVITATTYYCVSKITASGNVDYQPSLLKAVRVN